MGDKHGKEWNTKTLPPQQQAMMMEYMTNEFSEDLCSCAPIDGVSCASMYCKACCCPCKVFGDVASSFDMKYIEMSDPDSKQKKDVIKPWLDNWYCCMNICTGDRASGFLVMWLRNRVRHAYGIKGNWFVDYLCAMHCGSCTLLQMKRQMKHDVMGYNSEALPKVGRPR